MVRFGIELLASEPRRWLPHGQRYGLLCNQASVTSALEHSRVVLRELLGDRLVKLFSPQHGFFAEQQDNMIESPDTVDPLTGLPVFSLYSSVRRPTPQMLADIDVLLVDLQDVGCRVYTFASTLLECMLACAEADVHVCVLDRPNPIGPPCEGLVLEERFRSFVGYLPVPLRHGLTLGQLAQLASKELQLPSKLSVVPCGGAAEGDWWSDPWPWVLPSPNLPTPESCLCYAGAVLFEGTNVSEGRGTTRPFEIIGAPYIEPYRLIDELGGSDQHGCKLRAHFFEPTFNKWQGQRCGGIQIHVLHRDAFRPFELAVRLLFAIARLWPEMFAWKKPPYEYDYRRWPIDLIVGTDALRLAVQRGDEPEELLERARAEAEAFRRHRAC